jgi:hypothetical protein
MLSGHGLRSSSVGLSWASVSAYRIASPSAFLVCMVISDVMKVSLL